MKKYFWILLLIPSLCWSATGDLQTIGGKVDTAITSIAGKAGTAIATISGKNYTDGDAAAYMFEESFDGAADCGDASHTNCLVEWTESGTVDYNVAGLVGTYAASISGSNSTTYAAVSGHTGRTKIYATEIFKITADADSSPNFGLKLAQADGTTIAYARPVWSTDHFNVRLYYNAGGSNASCTLDVSEGEIWYVKIEYTPGTGENGAYDMYVVQDNAGFPGWGSACAHITNSTDQANVGRVYAFNTVTNQTVTVDEIRIDDADITY